MGEMNETIAKSRMDTPPIERVKNSGDETPEAMIFAKAGTFKIGSDHLRLPKARKSAGREYLALLKKETELNTLGFRLAKGQQNNPR